MASTNLNMQLLLRRDLEFNKSYILAAGEPGFEINTNTLKIGDGKKTWENLPIANKAAIDALIKVTDDKVVALTDVVNKLGDTYATDAELEAVRSALDSAKLDKATYNEFIATHAMTDEAINTAIAGAKTHAETKISEFNTATVAPIAQRVADIEADYTTASEAGDIAQGKVDAFKTSIVDGIDARVKAIEDAPYATANDVAAAQGAAEAAQQSADDLAEFVGAIPEGYTEETVIAYINKKAEETLTAASGGSSESAASVLGALNTYKAENDPKVTANTNAIAAINDEATGVLANAKAYVDANDTFEIDMLTINAHGGVAAGTNLNGLTTHEILKKILYPYVDATVGNATASPNGGTYEKGVTKTITSVSISVTKKSEPITSVALYNGSTLIEEKTGDAVKNGGTITFSGLSVEVPTNGNQLTVKVTYPDANGNAKTVEKKTTALTFVYPYYMGTCAVGTAIDETLVESLTKKIESKGNKSHSFDLSDSHIVFAYDKDHGVLKSIIDPNGYETIGGYNRKEVSVTGLDGTAHTYYVYVSKDAATSTGFVVNFKY